MRITTNHTPPRMMYAALGVVCSALILAVAPQAHAAETELFAENLARENIWIVGLGGEFPGAKGTMSYSNGIARLDFDFTKGGNYVTMSIGKIAEGGKRLTGSFRCECESDVSFFLHVADAKGDFYRIGSALRAADGWRDVSFDLSKLRWAFGKSTNAADRASVKWPVRAELLVEPAKRKLTGCVEAKDVRLLTEADPAAQTDWIFALRAPRGAASVFHDGETFSIPYALRSLHVDGTPTSKRITRIKVTDSSGGINRDGRAIFECAIIDPIGTLELDADDLGGRFGAFKVTFYGDAPHEPEQVLASAWFARLAGSPTPVAWCGTCFHGWGWHDRFRMMAAAGIGTARTDIYWPAWEKERGVYAAPNDTFREGLDEMHRLGIRLNAILNGNSHRLYGQPLTEEMDCVWASKDAVTAGKHAFDDEAQEAFARWAAWFATHDGRDVDFYEIWNEAWNNYFGRFHSWSKTTGSHWGDGVWIREFSKFSRKVADAIREVRPDAGIGVCAEDGQDAGVIQMLKAGIATKDDCITIHPYVHRGEPRPDRNPYFFRDEGRRLKDAMAANGGATRIRITEFGYPTFTSKDDDGKHDFWYAGGYDITGVSYHAQARYLVRAYLLAHSFGVESMMQYDFQDDGPKRDFNQDNFGLVFQNLTPKPSFAAVAFMTWALGDAKPLGDFGSDPKTHRILGFEFPDGRRVYVAWAVEDPVEATIPEYFEGKAFALRDLYGTPIKATPKGVLKLTEDPVYIVGN